MSAVLNTPAELLRDFVNTRDVESGADDLASPGELAAWLREHGLLGPGGSADAGDLALAVRLREGLREALHHNHDRIGGDPPPELPGLGSALAALPLRVRLAGGVPTLEPVASGVLGGLSRIAAAVVDARADGTWPRLKVCGESTCQWAFIDSSKNRSRAWCSMRVCGNRTKTRAYRARRQAEGTSRRT